MTIAGPGSVPGAGPATGPLVGGPRVAGIVATERRLLFKGGQPIAQRRYLGRHALQCDRIRGPARRAGVPYAVSCSRSRSDLLVSRAGMPTTVAPAGTSRTTTVHWPQRERSCRA